jgi:hypothetical protein
MFEVEHSEAFEGWYVSLTDAESDRVDAAVAMLRERGPGLGRPLVDTLEGSRIANLKELRTGSMRILFAFDPRRTAILLVGGDKRDRWEAWYREAIPIAEEIYAVHLEQIGKK